MNLEGKTILITGSARRVGRAMALAVASAGADVIIHHGHSPAQAKEARAEVEALGQKAHILQADFNNPEEIHWLIPQAEEISPLYGLVNSASIFDTRTLEDTTLPDWERHMRINLTAPFLLSKAFAQSLTSASKGRIVNILDWRSLRPGADHFPYTISKAGLAALTRSLAIALAPNITVNGLAFGAVLPPSDGDLNEDLLGRVPIKRWAKLDEVGEALVFALAGPEYITGEIIHLDGGRHLI